jgi:hypothetical protein
MLSREEKQKEDESDGAQMNKEWKREYVILYTFFLASPQNLATKMLKGFQGN